MVNVGNSSVVALLHLAGQLRVKRPVGPGRLAVGYRTQVREG